MATAAAPRPPVRRLSTEMKVMIITHLACFHKAGEVRDLFEKQFGFAPPLTTVMYYDPTTAGNEELGEKWRTLFEATREQYLEEVGRVPIMHKTYRAHQLQRILEKERERQNTVGERETLKQAAEEEGGVYTNRREHTGAGGAPIPMSLAVHFVEPGAAK